MSSWLAQVLNFKGGVGFQLAAWGTASAIGYVLYLRPKWYPEIKRPQARAFTPKEVQEWNEARAPTNPEADEEAHLVDSQPALCDTRIAFGGLMDVRFAVR
eukprot:CAMPEP_0119321012 /NCGR_PEP_ID=MMETSP1333-20130426/54159_1 /TAXON_ID=418940 /ORGANISM="Scyphosphaera apsteinii, Strain RCC1455" /LENGTH=100 /DNA_ID=CAMNT_0007327869 /DNA_START=16 /DNA_END=319 /DNA_ORIENTATION=+